MKVNLVFNRDHLGHIEIDYTLSTKVSQISFIDQNVDVHIFYPSFHECSYILIKGLCNSSKD